MRNVFGEARREDEGDWISVSDLMAGLMMIFLFVSIMYIRPLAVEREAALDKAEQLERVQQQVREIASAFGAVEQAIYEALLAEFGDDLRRWDAELERETLVLRFRAPDVLFRAGRADLEPQFQTILADFFPRYVGVLRRFAEDIDEVRIEGHTSSEWPGRSADDAYFENMRLSQDRTRAVLRFALTLPALAADRPFAQALVTANGLSSSRLVRDEAGVEDPERSRRVEFRIETRAKERIAEILETVR